MIDGAALELKRAGVAERCEAVGGSFFDSVPEGGDAYLMKAIIHDWNDDDALKILGNVRSAIAPDGKLRVAGKRSAGTFFARHRAC